jgi:predicted nucleotidyltransferase
MSNKGRIYERTLPVSTLFSRIPLEATEIMRLSQFEVQTIKRVAASVAPAGKVYLFGSRTDDTKRDGDIDLLILGEIEDAFHVKGKIWTELQKALGEQKIDVVVASPNSEDPFVRYIMYDALELV